MNGRLWQRGVSLRSFNVVGVYTGYVSCRAINSSGSTADPLFRLTNQAAGGDVLVGRSFSKAPTNNFNFSSSQPHSGPALSASFGSLISLSFTTWNV